MTHFPSVGGYGTFSVGSRFGELRVAREERTTFFMAGDQMADKPWYHQGLKFTCTQCGDCCTGAPGFVWVNQDEIAGLARVVGVDIEQFEKLYVRAVGIRRSLVEFPNGDCVFFDGDSRRCTVYEARPRQCRTWPFWDSNLKSPEAWRQTCDICPGSGRGKLYSLEQIEERGKAISV